jgi:hypothetical protein
MHRKACDEDVQEVKMMTDNVNISQKWQDKSDETQLQEEGVEAGVEEGGGIGKHDDVVIVLF